jgi:hypothetical protein
MRVSERIATTATSGSASAARRVSGGARFTLGGDVARPAAVQAAAPPSALMGLLAVQAAGDSLERKRRAMRRGRNILDSLDELKVALLSGTITPGRIELLRAQLGQRADYADDPALADLLAQIELRAEVEIAKLTQRRQAKG